MYSEHDTLPLTLTTTGISYCPVMVCAKQSSSVWHVMMYYV